VTIGLDNGDAGSSLVIAGYAVSVNTLYHPHLTVSVLMLKKKFSADA